MAEKQKSNKLIVVVIILMVVLLGAAGVIITLLVMGGDNTSSVIYDSETGFHYDVTASILTSGEVAVSQPDAVNVRFNPLATSNDGVNFRCEIGNSLANSLDMMVYIYFDMVDQEHIYTSGLMRPGEGITTFTADHKIPSGSYDVVLLPTLVEDDHKTIHSQSSVYLTLVVE